MGAVAVRHRLATGPSAKPSATAFRAAVERAFELADSDEDIGPAICAANPRLRFEFTDAKLAFNVWAGDDGRLHWKFGDVEWTPKLTLAMSIATANRYLQGDESLAVAIAHGEVEVRGATRAALRYLPATQMLREPYRRVVADDYPELAT